MTRLSKVLIAAAAMIAVPVQSAMAQDTPPEGEGEAAPPPEDASGMSPPPSVMEGQAGSEWAMEIIKRPLTLKKGMIAARGDLSILKITTVSTGTPPVTSSATGVALGIGAGYGISDKLEAGISYGLSLKSFEAKGPLSVYGLFSIKDSPKMRVAAGAQFGYNLASEKLGIGAGLAFQYHLNDKMMVYMPPTHLQIGLDPTAVSINLPVGFAFQATPNIHAYAQTNLFDIGIEPSGTAFIFADSIPLTVGAWYSPSNKMDIGASIGAIDLPEIADLFVFTVSARLYLGNVPASGGAAAAAVTDPATDATPPEM